MLRQYLCELDAIPDGGSRGAILLAEGVERDIFLVRRGESVFAYVNSCPHTGATLNFQPGQFMSFDNYYIQCSIHAAQFRIHDGYCIYGPCLGFSLQRVVIEVSGRSVYGLGITPR
ncbi:MAG: Rieske 2Fe-2S domain-containing protein [Gammaproteobacteria bacterium]|nr:Rieske 2Fe-2S domain-containing protein [Gammaproteobacteria bacterium]